MKQIIGKILHFMFVIFILIVLWKLTSKIRESFVPWNYKTDLIGILVVTPILILISFIISSLSFKVIRGSKD